ncbi:hypothetical protein VCUG_02486 [Vavraia culicis subsp. floridensis]|uniref:Rho-GAP domain-containing protein n=1 Tax=Vavraia culicis (isolate floridensis) TaxID=948595 RepID=L2GQV6_VAVCU|nr:uncharacterized protein VCUG_02486 [Vavraia culicis subsp. floridensis]ELA46031.1 hypothetical protein VCUG_02486 [Vavraia culicis subsp. floridensis]
MGQEDKIAEVSRAHGTDNVLDKLENEIGMEVVEDDTVGKYGSVFYSDSFGSDIGSVGVRSELGMEKKWACGRGKECAIQVYDESTAKNGEEEGIWKGEDNGECGKNQEEREIGQIIDKKRQMNNDVCGKVPKTERTDSIDTDRSDGAADNEYSGAPKGVVISEKEVCAESKQPKRQSVENSDEGDAHAASSRVCEMSRFVRRVVSNVSGKTKIAPGNDRIADHRFRSKFKVEHITFKNYQDKFIRYDDISPVEKYELYRYAVFMLSSAVSGNKLSFLKKMMKFGNEDRTETSHIHPFIFKIMDFIKTKRANYHGIFRCSGDYRASLLLYDRFMAGETFDLDTTDVRNTVAFFKIYLKKKVNGIFSFDILDSLYETAKHKSSPSINYLLFYLPFCFVGDKRKFLISLIEMFKEIDQHKDENDMPIPNLVRCIAPSLFPDTRLKSIETVFYQAWAVQKLFDIDLVKVPKPLLEFSHVYVVEKSSFSIC